MKDVPDCDQEHAAREETSLESANQRADDDNLTPMFGERTTEDTDTPGEGEEGEPSRGAELSDDEVGWNLEDEVAE